MMLYGLSIWEESICTYAHFIKTTWCVSAFSRWFPVRRPHSRVHGVRVRAATLVHRFQDQCSGTADPPGALLKRVAPGSVRRAGGGTKGGLGVMGEGVEASHR